MNGCSLQYIEKHNWTYLVSCPSLKNNMKHQTISATRTSRSHNKTSLQLSFSLFKYIFQMKKSKNESCNI